MAVTLVGFADDQRGDIEGQFIGCNRRVFQVAQDSDVHFVLRQAHYFSIKAIDPAVMVVDRMSFIGADTPAIAIAGGAGDRRGQPT